MPDRMNRQQFFERVGGLDLPQVRKVLWELYRRGPVTLRQRIEAELDAVQHGARRQSAPPTPADPTLVRAEVEHFVSLARAGSYLAGDRRVSPRERTRWRFTFHRLATEAQQSLYQREPDDAIVAVERLVDLACEMNGYDYFRSVDPVAAARFVVSDAVALLWSTVREHRGFPEFARQASAQLLRWESRHGWTRFGEGAVARKETSLAAVLAGLLRGPDAWTSFADAYLATLDDALPGAGGTARDRGQRTADLGEWHLLVLDRLADTDAEDRLDRLVQHPALGGPEQRYLQARLAHHRGDLATARRLVKECLQKLPGHPEFLQFAADLDAELPPGTQPQGAKVSNARS